jgi:ribosomal protein S18 acetylase RimI-like enzyme
MALEIRLARPAELTEVGELTMAAYAPFTLGPHDPYVATLRDAAGRAERADLWVAVEDGVLVGTVTDPPPGSRYREIGGADEGEFRMLAVAPTAQGRGVGRALVEFLLGRYRERGYRGVVLSTLAEMSAAHRVYEQLGFRRTPELDWSPLPGVSLISFRLDLVGPVGV